MNSEQIGILQAKINQIHNDTEVIKKVLRLCAKMKEEGSQKEDEQKLNNLLAELEKVSP